jgi:hypothetical protein
MQRRILLVVENGLVALDRILKNVRWFLKINDSGITAPSFKGSGRAQSENLA